MTRFLLLFGLSCLAQGATWFATTSSANIDAVNWVPTSTGSCTGSGTALVWASRANGDVFNANGCTAIAINTDPGSVSITVTLQTHATLGGGYTYAMTSALSTHFNIGSGGNTTVLTITASTGSFTNTGSATATTGTSSILAISDGHTGGNVTWNGPVTGGGSTGTIGYQLVAGSGGTVTINGVCTGGAGSGAHGCNIAAGSPTVTITDNCVGSASSGASSGCVNPTSTGTMTVTGNLIHTLRSSAISGGVLFVPAAGKYELHPKTSSYTTGTIDANATQLMVGAAAAGVAVAMGCWK